ncbi:MAG: hypothetical protein IK088_06055 [Lachnospiraceae bacterium]|nr:hypothetical protein [Lachnospiraceae bacterium]
MRARAIAIRRYEFFWWSGILIPIILGAVLYCMMSSDSFFSSLVRRFFTMEGGKSEFVEKAFIAVCMYGRDFLWSYALVFAISYCFRGSFKGLKKAFLIVLGFEVIVEILKTALMIGGKFDIWSVVTVLIGNVAAIAVVLIHERALL